MKRYRRRFRIRLGILLAGFALGLYFAVASILSPPTPESWGHSPSLVMTGDTNRDGQLSQADWRDRHQWSWSSGAFMLANVDDDDQDGFTDATDTIVNGLADEQDLAIATLDVSAAFLQAYPEPWQLVVQVDEAAQPFVHLFQHIDGEWQFLDPTHPMALSLPPNSEQSSQQLQQFVIGLEATQFADQHWSGLAHLTVRMERGSRQSRQHDDIEVRVAPWLMTSHADPVTDLYIGKGYYDNDEMRSQLRDLLPPLSVKLHEYESNTWQEMWAQDMMEIGYQEIPGHPGMHVVLQANRGIDDFPETLLGPDVGYITIGTPRLLRRGDTLADWFGNLEVTPPLRNYPLGRIYYGKNQRTNVTLHPEIVDFLERQEAQAPLWFDTSWLLIKHVDEIINFVPGEDGEPYLLINNMGDGIELLRSLRSQGLGEELISQGTMTVNEAIATFSPISQRVDQLLNTRILRKARQEFDLNPDHIISLPALITSPRNASTLWSNSVNSLVVNGTLILGDPHAPMLNGNDAIAQVLQQRLRPTRLELAFVDDTPYHVNYGNVHCATNTKRAITPPQFWTAQLHS